MQVSAVTFHYYARTVAFDNEYNYLITSTVVHLHSSLLSVPDCFCSLFLFPFNTCLLLNKHREVVYSLRLHSDCDRPTIIFHTTFLYLISIGTRFTAHLARTRGERGACSKIEGYACQQWGPTHKAGLPCANIGLPYHLFYISY